MSLSRLIKALFHINFVKTIWFNLKMLPLRDAYKLPFIFYGRTKFRSLKGHIELMVPAKMRLVQIGTPSSYVANAVPMNIIHIDGTLKIFSHVSMGMGAYLEVDSNGVLTFGRSVNNRLWFGSNARVWCTNTITIEGARFAWDCQVIDTNFHEMELIQGHKSVPLSNPIKIGNHVWVGNRTTIYKNTVLPDETIVASNSIVNKDFSNLAPYCLLAGTPAVLKQEGIKRSYENDND